MKSDPKFARALLNRLVKIRNPYIKYSALFLLLLYVFFFPTDNSTPTNDANHSVKILKKVSDGDTVNFSDGTKCRILYIDTPEKYDSDKLYRLLHKCNIDKDLMLKAGNESSKKALKILEVGEYYRVLMFEKDKYGRILCDVILQNGKSYSAKMVEEGYAVLFKHGEWIEDDALKNSLRQGQRKAKEEKLGLWQHYKNVMECLESN